MNYLLKAIDLLTKSERKRASLLMSMILFMALLDTLGVASILPFMAVLTNPQIIESNYIINLAFQFLQSFGIETPQHFLFVLGLLTFLLLITSLAFKALTTFAQARFALMREYSIGKRLIEGYLHQPYSWFLNRHSADLGKVILSEINAVIHGGMMPLMALIAQSSIALSLLILLVIVDPLLALTVGFVLCVFYGVILGMTSSLLSRLGRVRVKANQERFTIVSEAFGAAKEVKMCGLEQVYAERFAVPAEIYARGQATTHVIAQMPRFVLEAIAFGGVLLIVLYLMGQSGSLSAALPTIALYVFAGYRLLPALQQIYGALTQLRFAGPALDALQADLRSLQTLPDGEPNFKYVPLTHAIELKQVTFSYPNATIPTLKGLNLCVPVNSTVAFVGATGSGKTTVIDIILGLLDPQSGSLIVDGQEISSVNRRQWQRTIGYVPQQIYLSDDSIAANIAFGVNVKDIDQKFLERVAKIANLYDFITNELQEGFNTIIGERGVRLSGGQRQRIGIARALYRNPQVLVMDEGTSALDNLTERAVMEAISNLGHSITIILVAHRLSTVRQCDQIYLMEDGFIKAKGNYGELLLNSKQFNLMANQT